MAFNSKTIGAINFGLRMQTDKFSKDTKKARGLLSGFTKSLSKTTLAVTGLGTALGAGGLVLSLKRSMQAIDSLAKTSDKLGITTEKLAGLRLAAEESGVSTRTLDMALQRMVRRISEAARGTGESVKAIKELGLSAKQLSSLAPDQQFAEIAQAMSLVENQSDKVRLAFKLFDSEGVAIVNTLKKGKAGLLEAEEAAKRLGIAVDRDAAEKVEKANDAIGRMNKAFKGLSNTLAVKLAPALERAAKGMERLLQGDSGPFSSGVRNNRSLGVPGFRAPRGSIGLAVSEFLQGLNQYSLKLGTVDSGLGFNISHFPYLAQRAPNAGGNSAAAGFRRPSGAAGVNAANKAVGGLGGNMAEAVARGIEISRKRTSLTGRGLDAVRSGASRLMDSAWSGAWGAVGRIGLGFRRLQQLEAIQKGEEFRKNQRGQPTVSTFREGNNPARFGSVAASRAINQNRRPFESLLSVAREQLAVLTDIRDREVNNRFQVVTI